MTKPYFFATYVPTGNTRLYIREVLLAKLCDNISIEITGEILNPDWGLIDANVAGYRWLNVSAYEENLKTLGLVLQALSEHYGVTENLSLGKCYVLLEV
jgi:hypothetical protein